MMDTDYQEKNPFYLLVFMLNLQSKIPKYFFDNNLHQHFDEKDLDKSFTNNLLES